jgi:hypothetical protein
MHSNAILLPILALAMWTMLVLLMIPFRRIGAARKREVRTEDFKYGESSTVPGYVSLPNRNYMNLLELPVLFYALCLMLYASKTSTPVIIGLAWLYVALRIVHSVIHLSYNHVIHRLLVFAVSNFVLLAILILTAMQVLALA